MGCRSPVLGIGRRVLVGLSWFSFEGEPVADGRDHDRPVRYEQRGWLGEDVVACGDGMSQNDLLVMPRLITDMVVHRLSDQIPRAP